MKNQDWPEWGSLVFGIWLFLSPWMLRFFDGTGMDTLNFLVMGIVLAGLAGVALYMHMHALWEDWVTLALGLWMIASPYVLGFADNRMAAADAVLVGIIVIGLALSAMYRDSHQHGGDRAGAAR